MKMNSARLQPVQQVAAGREERALEDFLHSQRKLADAQARLRELCDYAEGYARPAPQLAPGMLVNRQAFLERLHAAIEFQRREIAQAQAGCELERARWLLASRDVRVLDKLSECYRARERRATELALQKDQDDRYAAGFHRTAR